MARFWLAALCLLAYAPTLSIPLLEDDFPNIEQSIGYGSTVPWTELLSDSTFRLRATSYPIFQWTHAIGGLQPEYYRAVSLLLHIIASWLLYAVARSWRPFHEAAFWAAAFFAIHEGHQEAVMWFSAINELLLFIFGLAAIQCWQRAEVNPRWHAAGVPFFALALLSKESALILLLLFVLVRPGAITFRYWPWVPYLLLALGALSSVVQSRFSSFRFMDGSFSLSAPFWLVLPRGVFRLLWIWGVLAIALWAYRRLPRRAAILALMWIAAALIPYAFLTYSLNIPSRQVYLASAGLGLLVGSAYTLAIRPLGVRMAAAVAVAILAHNVGLIWIKKKQQFEERAAPTKALIHQAKVTSGPIRLRCFPQPALVAEAALHLSEPGKPSRLIIERPGSPCSFPP